VQETLGIAGILYTSGIARSAAVCLHRLSHAQVLHDC